MQLPEWQDEKPAGDGAGGQASNNAPHVYPSYTDLVPPPRGKRDYALHEQSPEVQTMMSTAMYEVVGDCTFVNAFLDAGNPVPYYQSVLIQAATKHGYGPLAQRIKSDLSYIQPLGRWVRPRSRVLEVQLTRTFSYRNASARFEASTRARMPERPSSPCTTYRRPALNVLRMSTTSSTLRPYTSFHR